MTAWVSDLANIADEPGVAQIKSGHDATLLSSNKPRGSRKAPTAITGMCDRPPESALTMPGGFQNSGQNRRDSVP